MLVFVEGVDGSGKTKLVSKLELAGFKVFDAIDRDIPYQYYEWQRLIDQSSLINKVCLVDRSPISELVYRLFDNKEVNISLKSITNLLEENVKIIYCKQPASFDDALKRGEDNIVNRELHSNIEIVYDVIMSMIDKFTDCKILKYNWREDEIKKVFDFLNS